MPLHKIGYNPQDRPMVAVAARGIQVMVCALLILASCGDTATVAPDDPGRLGTSSQALEGAFTGAQLWSNYFCTWSETCAVGDVNGDGKADLIAFTRDPNADVWIALSTGSGFAAPQPWSDFFCLNDEVCQVADVNGDGKADLIAFNHGQNGENNVFVALALGSVCTGAGPATTPLDAEEQAFLDILNQYRAQNNLGPVSACTSLNRAAQGHSEDMRDQEYFSHTGLDGSSPWDRACAACYELGCGPMTAMGENIAAGYSGAQETFTQWQNSPGHNANMLGWSFTVIGIGRATGGGPYGTYWTTVFGGASEPSCN